MTVTPGIFPTFFLCFECSTFHWKRQGRRDLVAETRHDRCVREDYAGLRTLGIAVARQGVPWPLVEHDGQFDFSRLGPVSGAMNESQIMPVWDLCHYGYPDGHRSPVRGVCRPCCPLLPCGRRVCLRPHARPLLLHPHQRDHLFFCGGEWGWAAPYLTGREHRFALRAALGRAAIAGGEVEPGARMVNVDPLVYVVPPADRPDLADEAREETFKDTFAAWDILAGREHPEFGGSPEVLDIVGVNCYTFGQMEYREHGPHQALGPRDERIQPLADLLGIVWERYSRPIIIAETSGLKEGRPAWLKDVMEESLAAMARGIDLQGVCLFPAVDMPDWHTGEWLHNGIFDLVLEGRHLRRKPYGPYVDELRRWQRTLGRVTVLDEDPFSDPVNLREVRAAAQRLQLQPDRDWS